MVVLLCVDSLLVVVFICFWFGVEYGMVFGMLLLDLDYVVVLVCVLF